MAACENMVRGGCLVRDRKAASWRMAGPVRAQGAWLVREVQGALRKGLCGRAPSFR